ncbi:hypothetical protein FKM82_001861 [Ascaphus truei]
MMIYEDNTMVKYSHVVQLFFPKQTEYLIKQCFSLNCIKNNRFINKPLSLLFSTKNLVQIELFWGEIVRNTPPDPPPPQCLQS